MNPKSASGIVSTKGIDIGKNTFQAAIVSALFVGQSLLMARYEVGTPSAN